MDRQLTKEEAIRQFKTWRYNTLNMTATQKSRNKEMANVLMGRRLPETRCPHLGKRHVARGVKTTVPCGCTGEEREVLLPVYECAVYKRCVAKVRLNKKQLSVWKTEPGGGVRIESQLYQLCQTCEHNPKNKETK